MCDIGLKSRAYFIQEGKLFCRNDFKCEYDCVCGACNKEIIGERIVALNENFHKTCFHCSKCGYVAIITTISNCLLCADQTSRPIVRFHALAIIFTAPIARHLRRKKNDTMLSKSAKSLGLPVVRIFSEYLLLHSFRFKDVL